VIGEQNKDTGIVFETSCGWEQLLISAKSQFRKESESKASAAEKEGDDSITDLDAYLSKTKGSAKLFSRASEFFVGGQSHNARFFKPYPFFAARSSGKYIWDVDGNRFVDYWMGHTALILGHSPKVVTDELRDQIKNGLFFGSPNIYAYELGELIHKNVPCAESIRFCTTGAEATMYAVRLARAASGRNIVVKIAGGWHGYNSTLVFGVSSPFEEPESAGLVPGEEKYTRLISFNDIEEADRVLSSESQDIAAVIVEPVLGGGGVVPAERDFLVFLREKCDRIGSLLIFDEIITGFRLGLQGGQGYYRVLPDLCTLGKIIGGGLPASAIAGKKDTMKFADTSLFPSKKQRCWIGGGTFSENALAMRAGIATLRYLEAHAKDLYNRIGKFGTELRKKVDEAFAENGIKTQSTGVGSLFVTHFLADGQDVITCAEDVDLSRRDLEREYYFSLVSKYNIFFIPGHIGAISDAHEQSDIEYFVESSREVARRLKIKQRLKSQ
jgi:glutamate-1-semialdehyde 2,1-aminomutase